jgi:hypothetical protein
METLRLGIIMNGATTHLHGRRIARAMHVQ